MKKAKRITAILLVLTLLPAFNACGGEANQSAGSTGAATESFAGSSAKEEQTGLEVAKEGYPVVTQEITLRVAAPYGAAYKPIDEYQLVQEYKEKTGINIEWNLIPDTE